MAPPGNPLVAERVDSTTAITGIGIAESAVDLYNGISSGSWSEIAIGGAGAALEAVSFAIDPIGSLVSAGISWLIEHVKPLTDALDWLAGDPDTIASYAQTWRNVSGHVNGARESFDTAVAQQTAQWTGAAGDAYRASATRQADQLSATATTADTVGSVVEIVGVLVGVVREIVRDLVADCIATLVARVPQWLAEAGLTLGLATPHIVASAVALISKWVRRIADVIQKLVRSINNLRPLLRRLDEIWEAIRGGLRRAPGGPDAPTPTGPTTPNSPSPVRGPNTEAPTVNPNASSTTTPSGTSPPNSVSPTPETPGGPDTPAGTTPTGTTPGSVAPTPDVTSPSSTTPSSTSPSTTTPSTTSPTGTTSPSSTTPTGTGTTTTGTTPGSPGTVTPNGTTTSSIGGSTTDTTTTAPPPRTDGRNPSDPFPNSGAGRAFEPDIDSVLDQHGITRQEFHDLANGSADNLTPEQARIVHDVRHAVEVNPDTVMSKVLPEDVARQYLDNATTWPDGRDFNPNNVGGYVTRQSDVADLNTPAELYDGLALNYNDTPFSPSDQRVYSMRFPADDPGDFSIPFGGNASTSSPTTEFGSGSSGIAERPTHNPPPFTGTGFTGSSDHIVPEFTRNPRAEIPTGAAIYEIDAAGNERVVGIYGGPSRGWVPVNGGIQ